jgi:hypothetical protein
VAEYRRSLKQRSSSQVKLVKQLLSESEGSRMKQRRRQLIMRQRVRIVTDAQRAPLSLNIFICAHNIIRGTWECDLLCPLVPACS